jgi:Ca2+-transporting ATPase
MLATPVPTFDAGNRSGLGNDEARRRLLDEGTNSLPTQGRHGLRAIAWDVVREPMFLLLVAAGILYLVMGEASDAALLLGFVFMVMGITIVQERRTERALDALRDLSSPQALVFRDGHRQRIPASNLVRGDLLVLSEGDRIPADAVLRSGLQFAADESLLTGESMPVAKIASTTIHKLSRPGGDGLSSVFSGTLVTAGQGLAEVLATGPRSELGKIGQALSKVKPERTRLQQETGRLVRILAFVGLTLCCLVVALYALSRGGSLAHWKDGLLAGIAMAMAVLPEELPVILTIFLALGAWRISLNRVLTRRMPAIETLGSATVLCTDKTGTLTENLMTVASIVVAERRIELSNPLTEQPAEVRVVLEMAALASKPEPFDPMERAIHTALTSAAPTFKDDHHSWILEHEYPLTPQLLAVTQAWKVAEKVAEKDAEKDVGKVAEEAFLIVAAKGAPEAIAGLCGLADQQRTSIMKQVSALAADGLRVLGVARGKLSAERLPTLQSALHLEFVGLIAFADPLRENVPAAVAECQTAGIRVVMITGDYPVTAQSIARQAGITNAGEVISGAELLGMSDADLAQRIGAINVFARVAPEQKLRIVEALKANREVVAMTGDGVNDAPALKAAHIGIAMGGRGTDVARESASLVLINDDFAAIVAAVKMGRRIFDNIKKAISFTFAAHVPIAGLSILPVFNPGWPILLLPVHIVFLEMVINPACASIFEAEQAEPDIMNRRPRALDEHLFAWRNVAPSLLQGASALVVSVSIFLYARIDHGNDAARALTFAALVASTIAIIITNRSSSRSLFAILRTPNTAQWWVVLGAVCFLGLVLALPVARTLFHFAPLHGWDLAIAIAAGLLCVGWLEILKAMRRSGSAQPRALAT